MMSKPTKHRRLTPRERDFHIIQQADRIAQLEVRVKEQEDFDKSFAKLGLAVDVIADAVEKIDPTARVTRVHIEADQKAAMDNINEMVEKERKRVGMAALAACVKELGARVR